MIKVSAEAWRAVSLTVTTRIKSRSRDQQDQSKTLPPPAAIHVWVAVARFAALRQGQGRPVTRPRVLG